MPVFLRAETLSQLPGPNLETFTGILLCLPRVPSTGGSFSLRNVLCSGLYVWHAICTMPRHFCALRKMDPEFRLAHLFMQWIVHCVLSLALSDCFIDHVLVFCLIGVLEIGVMS